MSTMHGGQGDQSPLVFVVAGEPSGDILGARLMAALHRLTAGRIRFAGVGGEQMQAAGLSSLFPIEDIAVMGFAEVLPRLRVILRRLSETEAAIRTLRPNVVVTIDSPGFTLRLARRVRPLGIRMVHYVAPQLWAWRPQRARRLVGLFDQILALFPFEPAFFASTGISAVDVGHPAIETPDVAPGDIRAVLGIPMAAPVLALLAGSRRGLVARMLPVYGEAVRLLDARHPELRIVMPVVGATQADVSAAVATWPVPCHVLVDPLQKLQALATADVAITTSGTATLELALAGLPMVVAYRASAISAFLTYRMIRVPHVALPNVILGRRLVPELMQREVTPESLADGATLLLSDPSAAAAQRAGFDELRALLGGRDMPPSERAARIVLATMSRGA